jgi:hypothetical protein
MVISGGRERMREPCRVHVNTHNDRPRSGGVTVLDGDPTGYYVRDIDGTVTSADPEVAIRAFGVDRHVGQDEIGDTRVSTVFLVINHGWGVGLMPVLWETMIFGGPHSDYCERYTSEDDARRRHVEIVQALKDGTFTSEGT